jgi:hypothetical protein
MSIASRVSAFNRRRKWSLFLKEIPPSEKMTILDVGFSEKEYSSTDNFIEKHYPYQNRLTALGVDTPCDFLTRYPDVKAVSYDGSLFPFDDKEFDLCWSNAVIEHVGGFEKQLFFLKEIKRVSRRAFITTPNKWFPVELHTRTPLFHYLPKNLFDKYLGLIGKKWATGDYMHLLSASDLKALLVAVDIAPYKLFRNRILGFTVDFAVILDCE